MQSQHITHSYDAADAVAVAVAQAASGPIGFDDIKVSKFGYGSVPNGYDGLSWSSSCGIVDPSIADKGMGLKHSGVFVGVTSGANALYNSGAEAVAISAAGTFDATSVEMTASFDKKLNVGFFAFDANGQQIGEVEVTIKDKKPTLVTLDFVGVHAIEIDAFQGKPDKHITGFSGSYYELDDLTVSNITSGAHAAAFPVPGHLGGHEAFSIAHGASLHGGVPGMEHVVHPIA